MSKTGPCLRTAKGYYILKITEYEAQLVELLESSESPEDAADAIIDWLVRAFGLYANILTIAAPEKRRKVASHILQAVAFRGPRGRRRTMSVVDVDCTHSQCGWYAARGGRVCIAQYILSGAVG